DFSTAYERVCSVASNFKLDACGGVVDRLYRLEDNKGQDVAAALGHLPQIRAHWEVIAQRLQVQNKKPEVAEELFVRIGKLAIHVHSVLGVSNTKSLALQNA